jgi:aminoglycoside phosphotransferase (APT) family kinase protein
MNAEHERLADLVRALVPDVRKVTVRSATVLAGGWSADTVRVQGTCEGKGGTRELDVVVRRVPADGLLAPYDIEREWRILCALRDSPVPVPKALGRDSTGARMGSPCLVTEYVAGSPLPFFGQSLASDDVRLPAYYSMLATVHRLDWRAHGLAFLDTGDDPVEAELRRDEARLFHHDRLGGPERAMLAWLRDHKPPGGVKAFVHGDANPANYLFSGARVAAVLDWELAVIGDPRLDLGFFAAIQHMFGGAWQLDTPAFLRGYAAANPAASMTQLGYFEAVALFRLTGFLHAAEIRRGADVRELRARLHDRFDAIAGGAREQVASTADRGGA